MLKKTNKILLMMMAMLMLLSGMTIGDPLIVSANDEVVTPKPGDPQLPPPLIESETIHIKRKAYNNNAEDGIIMKDKKRIPSSFDDAKRQARDPDRVAPGHTGWSTEGVVLECHLTRTAIGYDGKPVRPDVSYPNKSDKVWWWKDNWSRTRHTGDDPNAQIKYGAFQYNTFNQLDSGPIEQYIDQLESKYGHLGIEDWSGVRGELRGDGEYWSIKSDYISRTEVKPCTYDGELQREWRYNNNEIVMVGELQVPLKDPSESEEAPGRTDGDLKGQAYWELLRHNRNARSGVDAHVSFSIAGDHYATRNVQHTLDIGNQSIKQPGPISTRILDGMSVKNGTMTYGFSYDYTNHYRDIYRCSSRDENGGCFSWTFVERRADWNYKKTFRHNGSIRIDHRMEDVIAADKIEDVLKGYIIGRKDDVRSKANTVKTPYYEQFGKAAGNDRKSMNALKTQTALPITPGKLDYRVTFPSGSHSGGNVLRNEKSYGFFFPVDVDDSLKERYANRTPYNEYKYAFPLQQSVQQGATSNQVWDYDTDLFFMARALGYMSGIPYAEMVKQQVVNGRALPSYAQLMQDGTEKLKREFVQDMNYGFYDEVLYTNSQSEFEKLQRYQLPIAGDSTLHPNTVYKNHIVLRNMGLNDLTFRFNQSFSFEHYLFGSGSDEAWIIEQPEGRPVKMNQYAESDVHTLRIENEDIMKLVEIEFNRPQERIHGFRIIDRDIVDKVKSVIGDIGI